MAYTYLYAFRTNLVARKKLMMQKTEKEENSWEYVRG